MYEYQLFLYLLQFLFLWVLQGLSELKTGSACVSTHTHTHTLFSELAKISVNICCSFNFRTYSIDKMLMIFQTENFRVCLCKQKCSFLEWHTISHSRNSSERFQTVLLTIQKQISLSAESLKRVKTDYWLLNWHAYIPRNLEEIIQLGMCTLVNYQNFGDVN